jgi:hypothetical protein
MTLFRSEPPFKDIVELGIFASVTVVLVIGDYRKASSSPIQVVRSRVFGLRALESPANDVATIMCLNYQSSSRLLRSKLKQGGLDIILELTATFDGKVVINSVLFDVLDHLYHASSVYVSMRVQCSVSNSERLAFGEIGRMHGVEKVFEPFRDCFVGIGKFNRTNHLFHNRLDVILVLAPDVRFLIGLSEPSISIWTGTIDLFFALTAAAAAAAAAAAGTTIHRVRMKTCWSLLVDWTILRRRIPSDFEHRSPHPRVKGT